jgi:hypothetical protein
MNDLDQQRMKTLNELYQEGKWLGRKPYGAMPMSEAVNLTNADSSLIIATVAWWGELPAGYTWCELLQNEPHNGHYHVWQDTEPQTRDNWIPENEIVAVYYRNVMLEDDPL